ncbi:MAG: hypothetical protein IJ859_02535 [Synergistaceae bacterium]|nr:hypothetical protein [Synergistaceae bacterium]
MLSEAQVKNSKPKGKKYLLNEARTKRDDLHAIRTKCDLTISFSHVMVITTYV